MRYVLSTALALFLGLPALAQPPKSREAAPQPRGVGAEQQRLREQIRELETKLNNLQQGEKNKTDERKDDRARDVPKGPKGRESGPGGPPKNREFGPGKPKGPKGREAGSGGPPKDREFGSGRPTSPKERDFGPGGPPKNREFGAIGSMHRSPGEHHHPTPPGFDRLTAHEQVMFRSLMHKMMGESHPSFAHHGHESGSISNRSGSSRSSTSSGSTTSSGSSRKPSVEDRLDRIEKMLEELSRSRR